jgi:hypothetical protein
MESVKQTPTKKWEGNVMENNENLVTEEVAENVEQTTEETPKTYTQAEVDAIVGKRLARQETKIRKDYDRKYGDLMNTLESGTGKKGVDELNNAFTEFYESKGVKITKKPDYSDTDIETLAQADADYFIKGGFEEVVEEADRLKAIGAEHMTAREKAVFKRLAEHVKNTETSNELAKLGVTADVYNSAEFQDFKKMFDKDTPITKVYETYEKTIPKKEFKTMGSMKQTPGKGAKEFYTQDEIERLTEEDLDDPAVWEAVRRSMTGR